MRAGQLRHRVRIEYKAKTPDGAAGNSITWALLDVMPADVVPQQPGTESQASHQTAPLLRHTVTMRYRHGITPAMRLVFNGRVLQIVSIVNTGELNRELRIDCLEKVGETP
jgi:head-tail adaptor